MKILRTGHRSSKGFTFIEITVVMAILLSITGLLSIWLGNYLSSKELYMEALKISAVSNLAREMSGAKGVNYRVCFSLADSRFWAAYFDPLEGIYKTVNQVKVYKLKESVSVKSFSSPRSYYYDMGGGLTEDYVTFYPDGSAEPVILVLQNKKGEVYSVYYAATTGMVKVYPYEVPVQ